MGKRKASPSEISEALNCREGDDVYRLQEAEGERVGRGFFACYLLVSLSPRHKGHTYIGMFTVNPKRRIRQHNGEISSGARRTKKKQPWEMVLCIYGFPTNIAALQFEWAWQHPVESLAVRKAAVGFKSLSGLANKIKLAYTMLSLPVWKSLNLTVNFFSTKYTKHYAGCPSLPDHMKVQVRSMEELLCHTGGDSRMPDNDIWYEYEEHNSGNGESNELTEEVLKDGTSIDDFCDLESHRNVIEEANHKVFMDSLASSPLMEIGNGELVLVDEESFSTLKNVGKDRNAIEIEATEGQPTFDSPAVSREVEVIDVFTPSPKYRISSCKKKRGFSSACSQIIDLTKSPIHV